MSSDEGEEISFLEYRGILSRDPSYLELEEYYTDTILPIFGITDSPSWGRHIRTNPDNFLNLFSIGDVRYALAFDDHPSGFSIDANTFAKALKTKDGPEILAASSPYDNYIENGYGYFKLFKVLNETEFDSWVGYLENQYKKLQDEWHERSRHIVSVSRDIVRMADAAAINKDWTTFSSVGNIVDTLILLGAVDNEIDLELLSEYLKVLGDEMDPYYQLLENDYKKEVKDKVYRTLAYNVSSRIAQLKYSINDLGQTITLVTAIYAKEYDGNTSGITVSFIIDEHGVSFPRDHFINDELKENLDSNPYLSIPNLENDMPKTLGGYKYVAGSATPQEIFRRELEYISF